MSNYFTELNDINVNDKVEHKGKLSYLSWTYAWGELKKRHPDAVYTVYESPTGCIYHTDGRFCWVKTGVTVSGIEHIEYLPVMDNRNQPIPASKVTSFDANTAIQRSITKAIARHGLGLYIYSGEDVPDIEQEAPKPEAKAAQKQEAPKQEAPKQEVSASRDEIMFKCADCGKVLVPYKTGTKEYSIREWDEGMKRLYGRSLCYECYKKVRNP